jgi:hypothetical protein
MTRKHSEPGEAGGVGRIDKIAQIVLVAVLVGFALFCPVAKDLGALAVWGSGALGVILLVTALMGRCPLYRIFGIRT